MLKTTGTPMLETVDVARHFDVSRPLVQRVMARDVPLAIEQNGG